MRDKLRLGELMRVFVLLYACTIFSVAYSKTGPVHHKRDDTSRPNAFSGRYFYAGEVPKFNPRDIKLTASKLGLTLRVQAWVSQSLIDGYRFQMFERWWNTHRALDNEKISIHLGNANTIKSEEQYYESDLNWLKASEQYTKHIFDEFIDRNQDNSNERKLKLDLSRKIKIYLLGTDYKDLANKFKSRRLFNYHLKKQFTKTTEKEGYVGYLTFVYPMAATTEGPSHFPFEKFTSIKFKLSNDARWWSDKWGEDFGGFPFLLLHNEIGFHGPISRKSRLNTWFLQRGYVSHSCLRLDAGDIMELVQMFPPNFRTNGNYTSQVTVLNGFDIFDWNKNGVEEVMNVDYYAVPYYIHKSKISRYSIESQRKLFWQNHPYAKEYFDSKTMSMLGAPKYNLKSEKPIVIGKHESTPISFFKPRKTRIVQYFEEGVIKTQNVEHYNDSDGSFPPRYFREY